MSTLTLHASAHWASPEAVLPVWGQVCPSPFDRYPRLDPLAKLISLVAEQALSEGGTVPPEMGLILGTAYGCVEADLAFYRSAVSTPELASPQLFPYTLPSAGLAEVAIRHKIHGPDMVFLHAQGVGEAFRLAEQWLRSGRTPRCLVVHADAVLAEGARLLGIAPKVEGWAFLLSVEPGPCTWTLAEGSAEVLPSTVCAAI